MDVISAIVVAQVAAPAMRAAGFGTILVTGGGFADHPIPALATVSLEGRPPVGRDNARRWPGTGRHPCGHTDDRREDSCRYFL